MSSDLLDHLDTLVVHFVGAGLVLLGADLEYSFNDLLEALRKVIERAEGSI